MTASAAQRPETDAERTVLLLQDRPDVLASLPSRLEGIGMRCVVANDEDEAIAFLQDGTLRVNSVVVAADIEMPNLKATVKRMVKIGPSAGLRFIATGRVPDKSDRKKLRAAGIGYALWEPFDDGTLRFQLNRLLAGDPVERRRSDPRVPTFLLARVTVAGRTKEAIVYSLASTGVFLETPRATMEGAAVEVEIRLPGNPVTATGEVKFSNVPGNLQRPNLPLGMGVRFADMDKDARAALDVYVKERQAHLLV